MLLDKKIFRAYDIRGEYQTLFDAEGFFIAAKSYAKYLKQKHNLETVKILVTSDGRTSHKDLFPAVLAGLDSENCDITFGGITTTPINFFAMKTENFDASLQISASHNPAQDNGLKLTDRNGSVCGDEIQEVLKIAQNLITKNTEIPSFEAFKNFEITEFGQKYTDFIKQISPTFEKKYKIVIDAGNGVAGSFYPDVFRALGHEVVELYCDLNGNFPNHQPDPERPENTADCQAKVLAEKADFGMCFDGDGDRVGILLNDGKLLSADKILFALGLNYLKNCPNEKIVIDIMSSATLISKLEHLGGNVIVSPTGHSFIEENMHKEKADFGGEQSGHFMFGKKFWNFLGHDDACFAGIHFLAALEESPEILTEITTNWTNLLELSEKFTAPDEEKFAIVSKFSEEIQKQDFPKTNTIDGIRIDFDESEWAIIRCSNTSPKIAIRIEAYNEASLNEKKKLLVDNLKKFL